MSNLVFLCSLLLAYLLFTTSSCDSVPSIVCQDNGCDNTDSGCCTTSQSCSVEHPFGTESQVCRDLVNPNALEPTLPSGVEHCEYNSNSREFDKPCSETLSRDGNNERIGQGKPSWVGAEFQLIGPDQFSVTVLWEHKDYYNVSGYQIKIYQDTTYNPSAANGGSKILRTCLCVKDPSRRNVSNITSRPYTYPTSQSGYSHMIVEVQGYPWVSDEREEITARKNCSLLTGCLRGKALERCFSFSSPSTNHSCYSWPRSCLDYLPSYIPETCYPPLYEPPTNVKAQIYNHDNITTTPLNVSWQCPPMNYSRLFPVPDIYYITVEGEGTRNDFRAMNTTSVIISSLNISNFSKYSVYVSAYVPCSGFTDGLGQRLIGCGREVNVSIQPPLSIQPPPSTVTTTEGTPTAPPKGPERHSEIAAFSCTAAVLVLAIIFVVLGVVCKKKMPCHCGRYSRSGPPPLILLPSPKNICVFVFYPEDTEQSEEVFIQTYIVAPLSAHSDYFKHIKSTDDPDLWRSPLPESMDRNFRHADFIIIVCTPLLLDEWNSDECSPTVRLLRQYIGTVMMSSSHTTGRFITVVRDEQWKKELLHSRQNLGSLRSFVVNERTWDEEIQSIVRYMTRTPRFQLISNEEATINVLDTPDSPDTVITYCSQESCASSSRDSNSSLSNSDVGCSAFVQENGTTCA